MKRVSATSFIPHPEFTWQCKDSFWQGSWNNRSVFKSCFSLHSFPSSRNCSFKLIAGFPIGFSWKIYFSCEYWKMFTHRQVSASFPSPRLSSVCLWCSSSTLNSQFILVPNLCRFASWKYHFLFRHPSNGYSVERVSFQHGYFMNPQARLLIFE